MRSIKKYTIFYLAFLIILFSGCSKFKGIYNNTEQNKSNDTYVSLTGGVKKIISTDSTSIKKIQTELQKAKIVSLRNGRYIVITDNMTLDQLNSKLTGIKEIKKVEDPKIVNSAAPNQKKTIDKNFALSEKQLLDDNTLNDPGYKYEWAIGCTESNKAWSLVSQKKLVKVAVVDTGIDYNHPDLKNRIVEDSGYDFINNRKKAYDDNGHGTYVSGIIAAEANNGIGISGIAGPLNVKIIPIKVLNNKGQGESDIIAQGIMYAADHGADIINLSFTCTGKSSDIAYAVQYAIKKGCFISASAGDSSKNCDTLSPAGDLGSYTVSAINQVYLKTPFSNYGNSVQASAPGVNIISTIPGEEYESWDSTSASSAIVSGVGAIIKAYDSSIKPDKMSKLLDESSVDIMEKGKDSASGLGLVNAYKAIMLLKSSK